MVSTDFTLNFDMLRTAKKASYSELLRIYGVDRVNRYRTALHHTALSSFNLRLVKELESREMTARQIRDNRVRVVTEMGPYLMDEELEYLLPSSC